jgi:hypothetical protein
MRNELGRIWKEAIVAQLRYNPIFLEELGKTTTKSSARIASISAET